MNRYPSRNRLFIDGVEYDVSNLLQKPKDEVRLRGETPKKPAQLDETSRRDMFQRSNSRHNQRSSNFKRLALGIERTPSFRNNRIMDVMERSPSFRKNNERRGRPSLDRSPSFRKKNERLGLEKSPSFRKKNDRFSVERSHSFRTKHKLADKEWVGLKKAPHPPAQPSSMSLKKAPTLEATRSHPDDFVQEAKNSDFRESAYRPGKQGHEPSHRDPNADYFKTPTVEIFPGVWEVLRGADETKVAVEREKITTVHCICCDTRAQCIEDACYFICPTCQVVGPVPASKISMGMWGVGLGIKTEHRFYDKEWVGLKKAPPPAQPSSMSLKKAPTLEATRSHPDDFVQEAKNSDFRESAYRPGKQGHEPSHRDPNADYFKTPTVEIFPGVWEVLRGADETKVAIERGKITTVHCICCDTRAKCIEDACYFICPTCRVVGPVPVPKFSMGAWGVGLGIKAL